MKMNEDAATKVHVNITLGEGKTADDVVAKLREVFETSPAPAATTHELVTLIERLRAERVVLLDAYWKLRDAGDALAAVLRSGSDCGWDNAIDRWEWEARRGS